MTAITPPASASTAAATIARVSRRQPRRQRADTVAGPGNAVRGRESPRRTGADEGRWRATSSSGGGQRAGVIPRGPRSVPLRRRALVLEMGRPPPAVASGNGRGFGRFGRRPSRRGNTGVRAVGARRPLGVFKSYGQAPHRRHPLRPDRSRGAAVPGPRRKNRPRGDVFKAMLLAAYLRQGSVRTAGSTATTGASSAR